MSRADPMPRRRPQSPRQIFAMPTAIALLSLFGLIAALSGDGLRDAVSWIGLAAPIAATAWAWRRRRS